MSTPRQLAQMLPPGLVLPYFARVDLAYVETIAGVTILGSPLAGITCPNGALMVVPFAYFVMQTGAAAGSRYAVVQYTAQDGLTPWQIPAAQSVAALGRGKFTILSGIGTTYGLNTTGIATGIRNVIAVPPTVFSPGESMGLTIDQAQVNDEFTSLQVTRVVIPTGPSVVDEFGSVSPVPTPILG